MTVSLLDASGDVISVGAGQDPPTQPPIAGPAIDGIKQLSARFPKPSNAQALAALAALFEVDVATAEAAGWDHFVAQAWFVPLGILPRMRLNACGWKGAGDRFHDATDSAWWDKEYDGPLWVPLATYVKTHPTAASQWFLDEQLVLGDSTSLSTELGNVTADLAAVVGAFADKCQPYLVPRVLGVQPIASIACLTLVAGRQKVDPEKLIPILRPIKDLKQFSLDSLKLIAVGVAIYYLSKNER